MIETVYWEAMCQDAAGHFRQARASYERFLTGAKQRQRYQPLRMQAQQRLAELTEFSIATDNVTGGIG